MFTQYQFVTLKNKLLIIVLFQLASCSSKLEKIPVDRFIGTWELKGRAMFSGIVIEINRDGNGQFIGRIKKLNDNKYVQMFAEEGDTWISEISRSSNFQFKITEKKIGRELFGLYGLSSSSVYKAEFIDNNTIGISNKSDPSQSAVTYERIK